MEPLLLSTMVVLAAPSVSSGASSSTRSSGCRHTTTEAGPTPRLGRPPPSVNWTSPTSLSTFRCCVVVGLLCRCCAVVSLLCCCVAVVLLCRCCAVVSLLCCCVVVVLLCRCCFCCCSDAGEKKGKKKMEKKRKKNDDDDVMMLITMMAGLLRGDLQLDVRRDAAGAEVKQGQSGPQVVQAAWTMADERC